MNEISPCLTERQSNVASIMQDINIQLVSFIYIDIFIMKHFYFLNVKNIKIVTRIKTFL